MSNDAVWSERGTTPDAIEAALRELLIEKHAQNGGFVPARVLNMVAFVESEYSAEVTERLRGVGRYHASRTIVLSYEQARERMDARVSVSSEGEPGPEQIALLRETVVVEIGERHLDDLPTIVDPLVVSDLSTLLWSPHGHHAEADALLELAQATLIDSIEEQVWREAIDRACELSEQVYVVDLAWLRSTPWRERVAATFDPATMRAELGSIEAVTIRHHQVSTVAAMLFAGWLGSRLGWELGPLTREDDGTLKGVAHAHARARGTQNDTSGDTRDTASGGDIALCLQTAPEQEVPGLAGVELKSESGLRVRLDRGEGGLREHRRGSDGKERTWTVLGASRGEGGILGEGIRQALLRDPTYRPALKAAQAMLPADAEDARAPARDGASR